MHDRNLMFAVDHDTSVAIKAVAFGSASTNALRIPDMWLLMGLRARLDRGGKVCKVSDIASLSSCTIRVLSALDWRIWPLWLFGARHDPRQVAK